MRIASSSSILLATLAISSSSSTLAAPLSESGSFSGGLTSSSSDTHLSSSSRVSHTVRNTKLYSRKRLPRVAPQDNSRIHSERDSPLAAVGGLLEGLPLVGPLLVPLVDLLGLGEETSVSTAGVTQLNSDKMAKIQDVVSQASDAITAALGSATLTDSLNLPVSATMVLPSTPTLPVNPPNTPSLPFSLPDTPSLPVNPPNPPSLLSERDSPLSALGALLEGLPLVGPLLAPLIDLLGLGEEATGASMMDISALDADKMAKIKDVVSQASSAITAALGGATATLTDSLAVPVSTTIMMPSTPSLPANPPNTPNVLSERDSPLSAVGSLVEGLPLVGPLLAPLLDLLGLGEKTGAQATSMMDVSLLDTEKLAQIQDAVTQASSAISAALATATSAPFESSSTAWSSTMVFPSTPTLPTNPPNTPIPGAELSL